MQAPAGSSHRLLPAIDGRGDRHPGKRGGSTNGATLAAKMEAFHKVPTLSGLREFLADAPYRVRPSVPGHGDPEQRAEARRRSRGEGRAEDLVEETASRQEARGRSGRSAVSRSFEGVQALPT